MRINFARESGWVDKMEAIDDVSSPADLSLEAAIELEELKQGIRNDVPSLSALFHLIRTPLPTFSGKESIRMMADVRAYPLLRDSSGIGDVRNAGEFEKRIEIYLNDLESGVNTGDLIKIDNAKKFCLAFNRYVLARDMGEFYARRERQSQLDTS
jgi:hypothetical protein